MESLFLLAWFLERIINGFVMLVLAALLVLGLAHSDGSVRLLLLLLILLVEFMLTQLFTCYTKFVDWKRFQRLRVHLASIWLLCFNNNFCSMWFLLRLRDHWWFQHRPMSTGHIVYKWHLFRLFFPNVMILLYLYLLLAFLFAFPIRF